MASNRNHPPGGAIHHEDHHHLVEVSKPTTVQSTSNHVTNAANSSSPWKNIYLSLMAGAVAGAVAKTTIAPLDRTKILFQTSDMKFSARKALEVLQSVYQKQGFRALYRGNSATMARIIPYAAIQYASHEQYKKLFNPTNAPSLEPFPRFIAGSLAGVTASTLTYPLDFMRARMAVTHRKSQYRALSTIFMKTLTEEGPATFYRGYLPTVLGVIPHYRALSTIFMKTLTEEGPATFYRGYLPTVLGVIPYGGISFFTYETFKKRHREKSNGAEPSAFQRLTFGAVAGLCGQSASYPLDVVRRRMQTAGITKYSYDTIKNTAKDIISEGGIIGGLYKGLSMNWIKGPIAVGISFTMYDLTTKTLKNTRYFADT